MTQDNSQDGTTPQEEIQDEPNGRTKEEIEFDIRSKLVEEFSWDEEEDKDKIDKAFKLQQDRYIATQQKKRAQEDLEEYKKAHPEAPEPKEEPTGNQPQEPANQAQQPSGQTGETVISSDYIPYLYNKGIVDEPDDVEYLKRVMKITNKEAKDAINDSLFTIGMENRRAKKQRRGGQLPASKGGSSPAEDNSEQKQVVDKWMAKTPKAHRYGEK